MCRGLERPKGFWIQISLPSVVLWGKHNKEPQGMLRNLVGGSESTTEHTKTAIVLVTEVQSKPALRSSLKHIQVIHMGRLWGSGNQSRKLQLADPQGGAHQEQFCKVSVWSNHIVRLGGGRELRTVSKVTVFCFWFQKVYFTIRMDTIAT